MICPEPSRRRVAGLLACLGLAAAVAAAAPLQAAPTIEAAGTAYPLIETWRDLPAPPVAGRFGQIVDLAAAPDGTLFVLDGALAQVHVLDRSGRPRRLIPLLTAEDAALRWTPQRLDVGPDGTLIIVSAALAAGPEGYASRVDRISPDGRQLGRFMLRSAWPQPYRDLAVAPDGTLVLSRVHAATLAEADGELDGLPEQAIELRTAEGRLRRRLSPPALSQPGSLALAPDGRLYVVNRVQPNLNLPGGGDPRPSGAPPEAPQDGILVFDPQLALEALLPFNAAQDLTAGPSGVFVSRNVEVFALGEALPLYSGPVGNAAAGAADALALAALPDGGLAAGLSHCAAQALLLIDAPDRRPAEARWLGETGAPPLGGPDYPVALAADRGLALLQGRYAQAGAGAADRLRADPQAHAPQTLQRWEAGRPTWQQGLCSGSGPWRARDLAMDGETVYALDAVSLRRFDAGPLPTWTRVPLPASDLGPAPRLWAVDADAGRLALLDRARGAVLVWDAEGVELARWPAGGDAAGAVLPVDLALDGERLLLADRGRRRILVRDLAGRLLASWATPAAPIRLAAGPEGRVFVLGDDAWVYAYSREGALLVAWPLPDAADGAQPEHDDIAVDVAGRVYLSFARLRFESEAPAWSLRMPSDPIARAGVWVFEPDAELPPAEPGAAPEPGACLLRPEAEAAPPRGLPGSPIEIRLGLDGHCFARPVRAQVLILLDASRSMGFRESLERSRESLTSLLGMLDRAETDLALMVFDEKARLLAPLGSSPAAIEAALAGVEPRGGTWAESGLQAALALLTEAPADPGARRSVVLVTDGAFDLPPEAEAEALRAAGVELQVLAWVNEAFEPARHLRALERLAGGAERLRFAVREQQLAALAAALSSRPAPEAWLATLAVEAPLPAGLRYLPGSARPAARYDAASRRLTWARGAVPAGEPLELRFTVQAEAPLRWPQDAVASAAYVDAAGSAGRLDFPAPALRVVAAVDRLWLPWTGR